MVCYNARFSLQTLFKYRQDSIDSNVKSVQMLYLAITVVECRNMQQEDIIPMLYYC